MTEIELKTFFSVVLCDTKNKFKNSFVRKKKFSCFSNNAEVEIVSPVKEFQAEFHSTLELRLPPISRIVQGSFIQKHKLLIMTNCSYLLISSRELM